MSIRRWIVRIAPVVALALLGVGSVRADDLIGFANAGGNNPAAGDYITYTPGTGGGFTLITNNGFINENGPGVTSPATINFGTLTNLPGEYHGPTVFNGFNFTQGLGAGSFTITKGSTTLLSGTFGPSTLSGNDSSPGGAPGTSASGGITLLSDSVTYTGGTYFNTHEFEPDNGSLAITFKASAPIVANATNIESFVANDVITFSALPYIPEPAPIAGVGIGLLFVVCLGVYAKRRSTATPV